MQNFKEMYETKDWHKYAKESRGNLEVLLKHHKEDLAEYKSKGMDTFEILNDIKEIEKALAE